MKESEKTPKERERGKFHKWDMAVDRNFAASFKDFAESLSIPTVFEISMFLNGFATVSSHGRWYV